MSRRSLNRSAQWVNPTSCRQYKAAHELPQDIDVSASEARLDNGVLTLKLAKVPPESKAAKLAIN